VVVVVGVVMEVVVPVGVGGAVGVVVEPAHVS
jgi:hypothetical protein